jgi:hypothetical protein
MAITLLKGPNKRGEMNKRKKKGRIVNYRAFLLISVEYHVLWQVSQL